MHNPFPASHAAGAASLLQPWSEEIASLESDVLQRYAAAARIIDRLAAGVGGTIRILELGCEGPHPLSLFFQPERVQITPAGFEPTPEHVDFVLLKRDAPLSFDGGSFDIVVALDVLEHMPAEQRERFIAESLRVARHALILSCPDGTAEVRTAEEMATQAFVQRHGKSHPHLGEHQKFGLPLEEEVRACLRAADVPHIVLPVAPLDAWLPMALLSEQLVERNVPPSLLRYVNQASLDGLRCGRSIPYRKMYVAARSFDAGSALEGLTDLPFLGRIAVGEEDSNVTPIHYLSTVAADALGAIETERDQQEQAFNIELANLEQKLTEADHHLEERRAEILELQTQLAARDDDTRRLRSDVDHLEGCLLHYRFEHKLLTSFVECLHGSAAWKLTAPLRLVRQFLRPRGFRQEALIPWNQLVPHPRSTGGDAWFVVGDAAWFMVPCYLPAGWLRVRLRLVSSLVGRVTLYFESGLGATEAELHLEIHGRLDHDGYIYLKRPVMGVRFFPLDTPGQVVLEHLEVKPVTPLTALRQAVFGKLELLRRHGLVGRALRNGIRMLVQGRFRRFFTKLQGGLEHRAALSAPAAPALPAPAESAASAAQREERPTLEKKLAIVYVLKTAGLCGGVKVVMEHASRLYARGHDVAIYHLGGTFDWFPGFVPTREFATEDAITAALKEFRGIKVATWYETAPWVAESLQPGDRGYYLVQDIEESYGETADEVDRALSTYKLGLTPITEGVWVRDQLKTRFGLSSVFVSLGLDHQKFYPRMLLRDPNRILTQARTWSGGGPAGARLKGWETARAVILACHKLNQRTTLTTFSMEERTLFPPNLRHLHYQLPSDEHLAELYSRAGLYLMASNHEGFGLTAAEAMACGCPVVAALAQGNEEYCIDGVTALTAEAGDAEALARQCLRLQSDPDLARQIGDTGRRFIREYTWNRTIDRLEREFLGRDAEPEIIIRPPTQADVQPYRLEGPPPSDTQRQHLQLMYGTARIQPGEYPNLDLDAEPTVDWTIVIPSINDASLAAQCIASCRKFLPADRTVQFIVVDDGSHDGAVIEQLEEQSKELDFELVCNRQNLGFSASVNHGMRHARGRFVVLCNNDIVFFQPWLEALESAFAIDPHLGILGCKLLFNNGTLQHAGVDKEPGQIRWVHAHGKKPADHPPANEGRYCWSATGALVAMRRETLQRLGGYSTAYSTAYEDLDYSLNAWAHGVRVGYCPGAAAYHLEGGTRGATDYQKSRKPLWAERERAGSWYFEKKWAFLRHIEDFRSLLALAGDVQPGASAEERFMPERAAARSELPVSA